MNVIKLGGVSLLAVLFAQASVAAGAAEDQIVLKIADSMPVGHYSAVNGTQVFIDKATELSNGRLKFEYYPAQQLGKAQDMLTLAQTGVTDIAYVLPSYVTDKMPLSTVMELPGLFGSSCEGTEALLRMARPGGDLAGRDFEQNGVRALFAFMYQPYDVLTTDAKIEAVTDWQGLKIRTAGGATELALVALGASPVRMSPPEIFQSMSRGTIDGTLFALTSAESYGIDGVARYATTGFSIGSSAMTYVINDKVWSGLPADIQDILTTAGEAASLNLCEYVDNFQASEEARLVSGGLILTRLDDENKKAWNLSLDSVREAWAQRLDAAGFDAEALYKSVSGE